MLLRVHCSLETAQQTSQGVLPPRLEVLSYIVLPALKMTWEIKAIPMVPTWVWLASIPISQTHPMASLEAPHRAIAPMSNITGFP